MIVKGRGVGDQGLGSKFQGSGFRVWNVGLGVRGVVFEVRGWGLGVEDLYSSEPDTKNPGTNLGAFMLTNAGKMLMQAQEAEADSSKVGVTVSWFRV